MCFSFNETKPIIIPIVTQLTHKIRIRFIIFLSCGFPQGCDGTERAPERTPAAARDLALESTFGQAEMANENGIGESNG